IMRNGIPYFVNGLGGSSIRSFPTVIEGSEVRYDCDYGAMLVEAAGDTLTFRFISVEGELIDTYSVTARDGST
ncbi:MAG TPA: hypothetical protein VJZ27_10435, partial [Aggregatilineales bacterium]|nr:hypothetical protein [Aggregatilineales bacterium]